MRLWGELGFSCILQFIFNVLSHRWINNVFLFFQTPFAPHNMADALTYRFMGTTTQLRRKVTGTHSGYLATSVLVGFCRPREEKLVSSGSNGVKMFKVELISERNARESLERRRKSETERRERIFNEKLRTIGVSFRFLNWLNGSQPWGDGI